MSWFDYGLVKNASYLLIGARAELVGFEEFVFFSLFKTLILLKHLRRTLSFFGSQVDHRPLPNSSLFKVNWLQRQKGLALSYKLICLVNNI